MSRLSMASMAAAVALEVLFLRVGYFRLVPWETLPLVAGSFVLAIVGWRRRRGALRASWLAIASALAALFVWASFVLPRLPERAPAPERMALRVLDLSGSAVELPAAMARKYALVVLFRGAW
ncbi:MAG: DUF2568 domain-containing protein [Planctomycetes bacterium]|nr:DUF2568 domain-containing protein [Planctomycetota bacterium]